MKPRGWWEPPRCRQGAAKRYEGESVGEMNVIDPRKASADVKAARASRVWGISKEALDAFMLANPVAGMQLMRALATMLCRRIRKGSDRMLRQAEMAFAVYEWLD